MGLFLILFVLATYGIGRTINTAIDFSCIVVLLMCGAIILKLLIVGP